MKKFLYKVLIATPAPVFVVAYFLFMAGIALLIHWSTT